MKIYKTVRLGTVDLYDGKADVFCRIQFDGGKLSISGVEGPLRNGDAKGSCGQIEMWLGEGESITPAPGWSSELIKKFLETWRAWHLNNMRAGCVHQRADGVGTRSLTVTRYGTEEKKLSGWVDEKEHPQGDLMRKCGVCGYAYGSAWLKEDVPADVLEFLAGLPDSDKTPAWV